MLHLHNFAGNVGLNPIPEVLKVWGTLGCPLETVRQDAVINRWQGLLLLGAILCYLSPKVGDGYIGSAIGYLQPDFSSDFPSEWVLKISQNVFSRINELTLD